MRAAQHHKQSLNLTRSLCLSPSLVLFPSLLTFQVCQLPFLSSSLVSASKMNLTLQSSLFSSAPATDTLSSYYRRLSSIAALPTQSSSSCPPLPLHAGDVLEVHGGSNTGKSAVLLSCVLSCALPKSVLGFALHGCDRSCAVVDCDGRLSVYRLQCMLEERCSKAWQQHWDVQASSASDPSAADELRLSASRSRRLAVSLLTQLVLRRLRVVHVSDEVELMAALLDDRQDVARRSRFSRAVIRGAALSSENSRWPVWRRTCTTSADRSITRETRTSSKRPHSTLSHARSIACLPLPHPHTASSSPALVSRYSPVSPRHSLTHHSPDPLTQAQPNHAALHAAGAPSPPFSSSSPHSFSGDQSADSPPPSSVSDVLAALSSLCAASPPPSGAAAG